MRTEDIIHIILKFLQVIQLREASTQPISHAQIVSEPALSGLRLFRGSIVIISPKEDNTLSEVVSGNKFLRFFRSANAVGRVERLSKMKAIRVVMLTTGSFTVTWMPYFIACAMYVNCDRDISEQVGCCQFNL